MTTYLLNSLPNTVLCLALGQEAVIKSVTACTVAYAVSSSDPYAEYEDNEPRVFSATSAVGHESTAHLFSKILDDSISIMGTYSQPVLGSLIVPVNRVQVLPKKGDLLYCGLFTPPRRLTEGECWKETEILSFVINWIQIQY
jgi:hypothetical protein